MTQREVVRYWSRVWDTNHPGDTYRQWHLKIMGKKGPDITQLVKHAEEANLEWQWYPAELKAAIASELVRKAYWTKQVNTTGPLWDLERKCQAEGLLRTTTIRSAATHKM